MLSMTETVAWLMAPSVFKASDLCPLVAAGSLSGNFSEHNHLSRATVCLLEWPVTDYANLHTAPLGTQCCLRALSNTSKMSKMSTLRPVVTHVRVRGAVPAFASMLT